MKLPQGFKSAGLFCGIKQSKKKDLGIIFSETPCSAAGVFTTNSVQAHCVVNNKETLANSKNIQLLIVNSGNANACTGSVGLKSLQEIKESFAKNFSLKTNNILTASTGVIGVPLQSSLLIDSLDSLNNDLSEDYKNFAEAILTTDLVTKTAEKQLGKGKIVGITKGSGMIHPNMATMLAFIVTDLEVETTDLQKALKSANSQSFNQISVDGDTSTNDMVLLLANGASKDKVSLQEFEAALTEICIDLAKQIVKDGEGATKIFEISLFGAQNQEEAQLIARGISSSSLVKSAIFGADPNWGRILAAAGQHGKVNLDEANLEILGIPLLKDGAVCNFDKACLVQQMKLNKEIKIVLSVSNTGKHSSKAWGCDLTYDYVKINAEYTT